MSKSRRWMIVTGVALLIALAAFALGGGVLNAQAKSGQSAPTYQYVGVEQTIARIDMASGRIEILYKPREPKASLLTPDSRPWEWREVPVRAERPHETGRDQPPREAPERPGPASAEVPDGGSSESTQNRSGE
jgi:hypothetical protein